MSESQATCLFTEGKVTLPDQYQDRTVNVFTLSGENAPAFNISRDTLSAGEVLQDYIDRQLALMDKHLKGWKLSLREATVLGGMLQKVNVFMPAIFGIASAFFSSRLSLILRITISWYSP